MRFTGPLRLEYVDGRQWLVTETFTLHLENPAGEYVEVAAGFVTDFASVPRVFWRLFPPTGQYGKAAVIHDRLYVAPVVRTLAATRVIARTEADSIFLDAMSALGVSWATRRVLYAAVRIGGWAPWGRYRRVAA